jgi:Helicase associated domain
MDGSIPITPSLRHPNDQTNYHYHPFQMHHNPIPSYSMRPTQNNTHQPQPKNHPTSSGKSSTPHTHRVPHHFNHHTSKTDLTNKSIIFPHTEEKLSWLQSFENLKLYKKIYGDCNVPQKYKMNVKLGGWVVRFTFQHFSCFFFPVFILLCLFSLSYLLMQFVAFTNIITPPSIICVE